MQYSSPERLLTGAVDVGADLWAAGVMLFEMTAGHPYFQAESGPELDRLIRSYNRVRPLPRDVPAVSFATFLNESLHPDQSSALSERRRICPRPAVLPQWQSCGRPKRGGRNTSGSAERRCYQTYDSTAAERASPTRRRDQEDGPPAVDARSSPTAAPPPAEPSACSTAHDWRLSHRSCDLCLLPGSE